MGQKDSLLAPLDALPSSRTHSARKGLEDMLEKRENVVNQTVLQGATGADSQQGLQKKDFGQKLKQGDLSVLITLGKT